MVDCVELVASSQRKKKMADEEFLPPLKVYPVACLALFYHLTVMVVQK